MGGIETFLSLFFAAALAPLGKRYVTSPVRRWIKRVLPEGRIKRMLLTPLGYTKRARDEAAFEATIEDYRLLGKREERRSARERHPSSTNL